MNPLTDTVNTYFALLLITIVGAAASILIIHVATATSYPVLGINSINYALSLTH
jgi:hypothetical protein